MFNFYGQTRTLITEEKYVTTVLGVINRHCRITSNRVAGNCGWVDDKTKWYVVFNTTDKRYGDIIKELQSIGKVNVKVAPTGRVDLMFDM